MEFGLFICMPSSDPLKRKIGLKESVVSYIRISKEYGSKVTAFFANFQIFIRRTIIIVTFRKCTAHKNPFTV